MRKHSTALWYAAILSSCGGNEVTPIKAPPNASLISPLPNATFDEGEAVEFVGVVADDQDAETSLAVIWESDRDGILSSGDAPDADGNVHFTTSGLSIHTHAITLTVVDSDGESGTDTVTIGVNSVDQAPFISFIHPIPGESALDGDDYEFKVQAEDVQDDPSDLLVELTSDVDGPICTVVLDAAGIGTCSAALTLGDHTLTATVTDLDDNTATDVVVFSVTDRGAEDIDGDGFPGASDCDDSDASVHPGATEVANDTDDDCDGALDEGTDWYDDDGDCTCEDDHCNGSINAECVSLDVGDCNDASPTTFPGAEETCDGADNDCDGTIDEETVCYDDDGDGYSELDLDCDDGDETVYPGAPEETDGLDNNCNGTVDEGTLSFDDDGDCFCDGDSDCTGTVNPACTALGNLDCNDANTVISPAAIETCDGVDEDCNGIVDDSTTDGDTWYADTDADGYGDPSATQRACSAPDGFVVDDTDCDDASDLTHPGAAELCDDVDNNCDGRIDEADALDSVVWYLDADGDGFGDSLVYIESCEIPPGYVSNADDCDDRDLDVSPAADEACNGIDDNCDGDIDEDASIDAASWYLDADGDGHGNALYPTLACAEPEGYVGLSDDCDDGARAVYPGATETCDGTDNDCDGSTDEGATSTWYADTDGDSYGDPTSSTAACSAPTGYVANSADCDDAQRGVSPAATETCDGIDDDCDGTIDEDDSADATTWYADADGDGYGSGTASARACAAPAGYVRDATDCNDTLYGVHPGSTETCNGLDDDCDGSTDEGVLLTFYQDSDGDGYGNAAATASACSAPAGYVSLATDCNDAVVSIHPGAAELCNGVDDDCDGSSDDSTASDAGIWYRDADGDGYGTSTTTARGCTAPAGYVASSTDCNDANAAVKPTASETCNSVDDDCDGSTDEGVTTTYYRDADGDGYGTTTTTIAACSAPTGYVSNSTDCNDGSAAIKPTATETCNGFDDDCDGATDEGVTSTFYRDADGDTYGTSSTTSSGCTAPSGYVSVSTDCNDSSAAVHPGASETCNSVDDDCDGSTDEAPATGAPTYYRDVDGDGYGNASSGTSTTSCTAPSGYSAYSTDCNDANAAVKPGAAETCNSVDDDCDGSTDEGVLNTYYRDADGDGYGMTTTTTTGCSAPSGYVATSGDCNDSSRSAYPGATEVCDSIDNDCDSSVDEGVLITYYRDADGDGYGTSSTTTTGCSAPTGYVSVAGDCNDSATSAHNGATEACDGIDNDCDTATDEGAATGCTTYYYDGDNDGYGTSTTSCLCEPSGNYRAERGSDCYDSNANANPGDTTYYSTNRGDGSYDYDCDTVQTKLYTATYACSTDWTGFACESYTNGWSTSTSPSCGGSATWRSGCSASWFSCTYTTSTSRSQYCK